LSEQQKLSGILIENVIKQNQLQSSIIGIGINVNQTFFDGLPNATSMQVISGIHFDLDEVLQEVLKRLKHYFSILDSRQYAVLKRTYESYLFRKGKPSTFKEKDGRMFSGYIKGVSDAGHLEVLVEDDILKTFELKDVQLLF
jgi:BirA family biotin operon repressor/biotin-[acetyl-CoA-carboxylase] ligase